MTALPKEAIMTTTSAVTARAPRATREQRRTLFATGLGNALEWFDWGIYSSFAIYFAPQVFNPKDPLAALLGAMAIFAVGFVARPIGGWLFGLLADRRGRKSTMLLTVALASAGSLLIAVVPTYQIAGTLAAVTLLAARLIQGLAHGGEAPSAQTYLSEAAPKERRGLWSSLIYVSGTLGICVGLLLGVALGLLLPKADMAAWGWRIPFLVGALLGLYTLIARSRMPETEVFTRSVRGRERVWPAVRANWLSALRVIGLSIGATVCYYVWSVSVVQQAVVVHKMDPTLALMASVASNLVLVATLPFWGRFSDRFGRRLAMVIGTGVPTVLFIPLTAMIGGTFLSLFVPATIILVFMGATLASSPALMAELFPTRIRTVGVAIPYSVAVAVFGGTAPYLQPWANATFGTMVFSVYVIVLLAISTLVAFKLPETKGIDLSR